MDEQKERRRLTLVLLFCGVLGATGTTFGLLGALSHDAPLRDPAGVFDLDHPDADRVMRVAAEVQLRVLGERRAAVSALAVVNFVSSLLLLLGAQLARAGARRGLPTLRLGLQLSQAYSVIALGVNGWLHLGLVEALRPAVEPFVADAATRPFAGTVLLGAAAGLFFAVVFAGAQLAFYLWAQRQLARPEILRALEPAP